MFFSFPQIVLQEIPGEITLAFSISGCPLRCPGCHSAFTRNPLYGSPMNEEVLSGYLNKYEGMISCVLFYGGEWQEKRLNKLLHFISQKKLLTALYSGHETLPQSLLEKLDFVKLGPWKQALGGLNSPTTNQRLYDLRSGECLNAQFLPLALRKQFTFQPFNTFPPHFMPQAI